MNISYNNVIYFTTEHGLFKIEKDSIYHVALNEKIQGVNFNTNQKTILTKSFKNKKFLIKIDLQTKQSQIIKLPIITYGLDIFNNKMLSYGRLESNYDIITITNNINTSNTSYFTYLINNKLFVSKNQNLKHNKVDGRFLSINENEILFFEGMYVNNQENKIKGIHRLNNDFKSFNSHFPLMSEKIIRSLGYDKNNHDYYATTIDSFYVFNKNHIKVKQKIPINHFEFKDEIPYKIKVIDRESVLLYTHEKNKYSLFLYIYNFKTNNLQSLNKILALNSTKLKSASIDANKNIWVGTKKKGLFCVYNDNDNYVKKHLFKGENIIKIRKETVKRLDTFFFDAKYKSYKVFKDISKVVYFFPQPNPNSFSKKESFSNNNKRYTISEKGLEVFNLNKNELIPNVFGIPDEDIIFCKYLKSRVFLIITKNELKLVDQKTKQIINYKSHNYKINDVLVNNDLFYIATENNGVIILNESLKHLRKIPQSTLFKRVNVILKYNENLIYLGTNNGAILIDLDKIINRSITNKDYEIKHKNNSIHIIKARFTTPSIYNLEYRIDNKEWEVFNEDSIDISKLGYGNHDFKLRYLSNKYNHWDVFYTTTIFVNKKWYKRPIYLITALFILTIISSIGLLFLKRRETTKRLKLESIIKNKNLLESKLENVQKIIAVDLHDNFGNRLAGINATSIILQELLSAKEFDSKAFKKFLKNLDKGITQLNVDVKDLIWANNSENNILFKLIQRIEMFIRELKRNSGYKIKLINEVENEQIVLPRFWNRQILLIIKEAINNSIKHASLDKAVITIKLKENYLHITYKDFGEGFNVETVNRKSGILNMKQRADSIDCDLDIISSKEGTTVIFKGFIKIDPLA